LYMNIKFLTATGCLGGHYKAIRNERRKNHTAAVCVCVCVCV